MSFPREPINSGSLAIESCNINNWSLRRFRYRWTFILYLWFILQRQFSFESEGSKQHLLVCSVCSRGIYSGMPYRGVENIASQRQRIRCGLHDRLQRLICCKHTLVYSDLTFYACRGLQKCFRVKKCITKKRQSKTKPKI